MASREKLVVWRLRSWSAITAWTAPVLHGFLALLLPRGKLGLLVVIQERRDL